MSEQARRGPSSLWAAIYPWYVLAILIVAYAVSFIDRQILSLLVEPVKADLRIGDTQIGLLQGFAFAIFYTFLGIPLGRLADKHSRTGIIAIGVTVWSLMTAACGLAQNFTMLFLARVGVGVGEAALSPAAHGLITDYFPKERLGLAHSLYSIAIPIGGGLALMIGGSVAQAVSATDTVTLPVIGALRSWQAAFIAVGLPSLLLVPLMLTVREPARRVFHGAALPGKGSNREALAFFRKRWRLFLSYFGGMAALTTYAYANVAWLPSYFIRVHDWDRAEVGLRYGLVLTVFGTLGLICGGLVADRLVRNGRPEAHLITAIGAISVVIVPGILAPLMPSPWLSLALVAIIVFFGAIPTGCAAAMTQLVTPPELRGTFVAIQLFFLNFIGFGLGPLIVGILTDTVFQDPAAVGRSLSLVIGFGSVTGLLLMSLALKPYRAALKGL